MTPPSPPPSQTPYVIIGTGAVGLVFGSHLTATKHPVAFWPSRSERQAQLALGIHVRNVGQALGRVVDEPVVVQSRAALDAWLKSLGKATPTILVCVRSEHVKHILPLLVDLPYPLVFFQPHFFLKKEISQVLPTDRPVMRGFPGFAAYFDGNIVYNQTLRRLPTLITGPLAGEITAHLSQSGLPARATPHFEQAIFGFLAFGLPFLLACEYHGWHFISLFNDDTLMRTCHQAAHETVALVTREFQFTPPFRQRLLLRLPRPFLQMCLRLVMGSPETFAIRMWTAHAPKIRAQSLLMAQELIEMANVQEQPCEGLQKILKMLAGLRAR